MEPATISALAALAGATIGGVTSFGPHGLPSELKPESGTHSLTNRA